MAIHTVAKYHNHSLRVTLIAACKVWNRKSLGQCSRVVRGRTTREGASARRKWPWLPAPRWLPTVKELTSSASLPASATWTASRLPWRSSSLLLELVCPPKEKPLCLYRKKKKRGEHDWNQTEADHHLLLCSKFSPNFFFFFNYLQQGIKTICIHLKYSSIG